MSVKKRFTWTNDLEIVLIQVWESKLSDLRRQKRNSHVYAEIVQLLRESFPEETVNLEAVEVKNKISNLTQRYRTEKKLVGPSGGSRSNWKYYSLINKILGSLPSNDRSLFQESLSNNEDDLDWEQPNMLTENVSVVEVYDSNMSEVASQESGASESAVPATPTGPLTIRNKKLGKRKAQDDLDRELLLELKRSNDLCERELQQNSEIENMQKTLLKALKKATECIITFNNQINK